MLAGPPAGANDRIETVSNSRCGGGNAAVDKRTAAYASEPGVAPGLLSLDIYGGGDRKGCPPQPVVVYVHGGAWTTGDKANVLAKPAYFTGLGYIFVSVNYRLSPDVIHPAHAEDLAKAIAWIYGNIADYGGDRSRIALLGHSAGAHLVSLVSLDQKYLKKHKFPGRIACTASVDTEAYDVPASYSTASPRQRQIITNGLGENRQNWEDASPIRHVASGKGTGSFLVVKRGTAERRAFADRFIAALNDAAIETTVVTASGMSHRDVNSEIGDPRDTVITPKLATFFRNCLD